MISCLRRIRSFEKCCEGFENLELVLGLWVFRRDGGESGYGSCGWNWSGDS